MDLRSKHLSRTLDPAAAAFLESIDEDADLLRADLLGSAAHVHGLVAAGILSKEEATRLLDALAAMATAPPALDAALEDVHMNVEAHLTATLGEVGKKLHTARSRNDQVALDLRLAARHHALAQAQRILELVAALRTLADKAPDAVLPGFTHLQPAQPVAFAHFTGMHVERFLRDLARLRDAYVRLNTNPLGAAALAGTSFPVDPEVVARRLGFDASFRNSLDAVSDRDFLVELASVHAQFAGHVSQLAEDVILYTSAAFGFLRVDDAFATGSSIMPQKRNPDVFEVARANAGTATGELVAALTILKGLPSAYNRDLQEQKRILVTAWRRQRLLAAVLPQAVATLEPVTNRMAEAAGQGFTDATEVADHLVRDGVAFRDAHAMAARLVTEATKAGTDLAGLPDATFAAVLGARAKGVRAVLGPEAAREAKTSPGGTAGARLDEQRRLQDAEAEDLAAFFASETRRVASCEDALLHPHATKTVTNR